MVERIKPNRSTPTKQKRQKILVHLFSSSKYEHQQKNKCGMEISQQERLAIECNIELSKVQSIGIRSPKVKRKKMDQIAK